MTCVAEMSERIAEIKEINSVCCEEYREEEEEEEEEKEGEEEEDVAGN